MNPADLEMYPSVYFYFEIHISLVLTIICNVSIKIKFSIPILYKETYFVACEWIIFRNKIPRTTKYQVSPNKITENCLQFFCRTFDIYSKSSL